MIIWPTDELAATPGLVYPRPYQRRRGRHNPNVPDIIPENVPRMLPFEDGSTVLVDSGFPNSPPSIVSFRPRGKLGQTVFQRTYKLLPNGTQDPRPVLQRRRQVIPNDPRSTDQLLNRARFGRGMQAWTALTSEERRVYNARGRRSTPAIHGVNYFLRAWRSAHDLAEYEADAAHLRIHGTLPPPA